ncbi:HAD family hydrolase [Salinicola sp. V024]|uniref:HAD family hydrolase n=1 Tax=Salinicola sp. V024 TaxID=3459609 RepID=UPI004044145D
MKKLIVCDLDNTLYDWVKYFVGSFYAMVDEVVKITGCNRERLLDDFREVHRFHHDSEHPFALLETETITRMFPGKDSSEVANILDSAFYAFNSYRKNNLTLYPGVIEGLEKMQSYNIKIVAHTESKFYATVDRLSRLGLTQYFSKIYCRERASAIHPVTKKVQESFVSFPLEKIVELTHHQRKPSREVLLEICARENVKTSEAAYVGDSIARDILMAKRAEVFSIWAKYGTQHNEDDYKKLVRVSHWTQEDVKREKELAKEASGVLPDAVAKSSFNEVFDILNEISLG